MEKELERRALMEKAAETLRQAGLLDSGNTELVISTEAGHKVKLTELMADFAQQQAKPKEPRVYRGRMEAGE